MGLLGRRRGREQGVQATARIVGVKHHRPGTTDEGEAWPWEDAISSFGKSSYTLEMEVTVPGRDPFTVTGRYKVPAKAEKTGLSRTPLSKGLELPVRVDSADPERVEIDWNRFAASPDREEALGAARRSRDAEVVSSQVAKKPKLQQKMWANNKLAIEGWIEAVKLGNISREEIESQIQGEVDNGRMDPADAEEAFARLNEA